MLAPAFWQRDGWLPWLLTPAAGVYAAATARRVARPGWRAPVPVVCCGNAGVGGAGKTTLALDLAARLRRMGAAPAFVTRGYGGAGHAMAVTPRHGYADVGDEALLLAAAAPCWVGRDRAASARAAVAAGATVLIMDDGLQNPGLDKDLALLTIDGAVGFGNGQVLPAGPLREPLAACARRCHAAVLIGPDAVGAAAMLPGLPVLRAELVQDAPGLAGQRVLAFAGIGRPAKFFATLRDAGVDVVETAGFPDHHRYRPAELRRLAARATALDLRLATTPKDAMRLPAEFRAQVAVAAVALRWQDDIDALLRRLL